MTRSDTRPPASETGQSLDSQSLDSSLGTTSPRLLEELLAEHRDRLVHYIYSLVANGSDAEDICQRASLVMWKKFSSYDPAREFLPWALGIAFYEVQNFRRTAGAERLVFSSETIEALAMDLSQRLAVPEQERTAALAGCLRELADRDRALIQSIYWHGDDFQTAADKCGLALRTAYNRMHLIRRRLLGCVRHRLGQTPPCTPEP